MQMSYKEVQRLRKIEKGAGAVRMMLRAQVSGATPMNDREAIELCIEALSAALDEKETTI